MKAKYHNKPYITKGIVKCTAAASYYVNTDEWSAPESTAVCTAYAATDPMDGEGRVGTLHPERVVLVALKPPEGVVKAAGADLCPSPTCKAWQTCAHHEWGRTRNIPCLSVLLGMGHIRAGPCEGISQCQVFKVEYSRDRCSLR